MSERKLMSSLRERRFCAYLPLERHWNWVRGHKHLVERPLLVGYVFIGLTAGQSIYDLDDVAGLDGVMMSGGQAAVLDPWVVLQIAALEAAGTFDHSWGRRATMTPKQLVRVVGGQFAGWMAEVVEDHGDKVRVRFTGGVFQGSPLSVNDDQLVPADDPQAA